MAEIKSLFYTDNNGTVYEVTGSGKGCTGCAFIDDDRGCEEAPDCSALMFGDNSQSAEGGVIFVKE